MRKIIFSIILIWSFIAVVALAQEVETIQSKAVQPENQTQQELLKEKAAWIFKQHCATAENIQRKH